MVHIAPKNKKLFNHTILDQCVPPSLRGNSQASMRRTRLLGVALLFGPGMVLIMSLLLTAIDTNHLTELMPLIIGAIGFWTILGIYWYWGAYTFAANCTLLLKNGLILYFAGLWGVGTPLTVWAVTSLVFTMYLVNNQQSLLHISLLYIGLAALALGEYMGFFTPAAISSSTEALMAAASALLALTFAFMVTAEVRFLYERAESILDKEARTDALTGLANRRHFFEVADKEGQVAVQQGWAMAVILLDMDYFKGINDTYGHAVGDKALKAVADVLKRTMPKFLGFPARIAGDEFAAIIGHSKITQSTQIADDIRERISETLVYTPTGKPIKLSVSIGVAEFLPVQGETIDDGLARADQLLYKAKEDGRNRVVEDDRLRVVTAA